MHNKEQQFLKKILGTNYDRYETQIQRWKRVIIVRNPEVFEKIARGVHIKELYQTPSKNLYFEHPFSSSDIDRWQFELTQDNNEFLKKYGKHYNYHTR